MLGLAFVVALSALGQTQAASWVEVKKISVDWPQSNQFGSAIALDGDTVVVGAPSDSSAHIFNRDAGGANNWGVVTELRSGCSGWFGYDVAISGDTVVIGAPNDACAGPQGGVVYIYERNAGGPDNWGRVKRFFPSVHPYVSFGVSVDLDGDTLAVGASGTNTDTGEAYIFERNEGGPNNWGHVQKVAASDGQEQDTFGNSVALSEGVLVVGAMNAPGDVIYAGAAYVYERNSGGLNNWGQVKKLSVIGGGHIHFGWSVAAEGSTAMIGSTSGVWAYDRNLGGPNNWGLITKLETPPSNEFFGTAVALSGDTAIVGESLNSENGDHAGAAYAFERNAGGPNSWARTARFDPSDGEQEDRFGEAVEVEGNLVVIGSDYGGGSSGTLSDPGAAYIFEMLAEPTPTATSTPTATPRPVGGIAIDPSAHNDSHMRWPLFAFDGATAVVVSAAVARRLRRSPHL